MCDVVRVGYVSWVVGFGGLIVSVLVGVLWCGLGIFGVN